MKIEYGPQRVWNRKVHGGGGETKFPLMNDARRHPFLHLTNKFDGNTNIFLLLKKMFSPHGCRDETTRVEEKWFKHITNNVASHHWEKCTTPLLPSSHLDCAINSDRHSFLNPTMSDCIFSNLEQDSYGENAKKKQARRRMCMVDGSARSYSRQLNSMAQMKKYADQNALVGILAAIQLEKDQDKKKAKEKKEEDQKEKERKKIEKEFERVQNKINAMPGIVFDVQQGLDHVLKRKSARNERIIGLLL